MRTNWTVELVRKSIVEQLRKDGPLWLGHVTFEQYDHPARSMLDKAIESLVADGTIVHFGDRARLALTEHVCTHCQGKGHTYVPAPAPKKTRKKAGT